MWRMTVASVCSKPSFAAVPSALNQEKKHVTESHVQVQTTTTFTHFKIPALPYVPTGLNLAVFFHEKSDNSFQDDFNAFLKHNRTKKQNLTCSLWTLNAYKQSCQLNTVPDLQKAEGGTPEVAPLLVPCLEARASSLAQQTRALMNPVGFRYNKSFQSAIYQCPKLTFNGCNDLRIRAKGAAHFGSHGHEQMFSTISFLNCTPDIESPLADTVPLRAMVVSSCGSISSHLAAQAKKGPKLYCATRMFHN